LKGLRAKGDNREIWIKFGHDSVYRAEWDDNGNLSGIATALEDKDDPYSRDFKGRPIPDLIKHLEARAKKEEGGVFYIPTQPLGLPLAACVTETDDIGIEIDHLPLDEQKSLIALFTQVTGLEFASVLTSGGASVHAHLKMDDHYSVEEMHQWRRLAIIAFQSDPVTERLHQPMRMPGFYRKEKGAYQELLSSSDRRYTHAQLSEGFDLWFEYRGWACPSEISEQWFKEAWFPLLNSQNPASPALKASQTQKYLAEGNDAYIARRKAESEAKAAERKPMTDVTGEKISDVVEGVCDRASVSDFGGVDWQGQGGHYRGQCPFHSGKTGNSAWLSDKLGGFKFHCVSCTDDQPRSSFEYWVAQQGITGIDSPGLRGKDYVKAAEVFLAQYGLSLPRPVRPEANGHSKPEAIGPTPSEVEPSIESEFHAATRAIREHDNLLADLAKKLETCEEGDRAKLKEQISLAKTRAKVLSSARYQAGVEMRRQAKAVKGAADTGFAKDLEVIQDLVAPKLSYNTLSKGIFYEGEQEDFNSVVYWLTKKTGHANWNKGDSTLAPLVLDMAKENSFCPIVQYLSALPENQNPNYLEECVPFLFGISDPLTIATFKAQIVGSVRRVFEPGCHHRLMPILFGEQKKGKSTFIRNLYGEFSGAADLPLGDKDSSLIIQRFWGFEIEECDHLFWKKDASTLKSFVSRPVDVFRAPYERDTKEHPRRGVLWGTTNKDCLFVDETGNSRYPVIALPPGWSIPTEWVKENRNLIWAAGLAAYRNGESNELPPETEAAMKENSVEHTEQDVLLQPVRSYLAGKTDMVTLEEVGRALGFDLITLRSPEATRIRNVMRTLGWENKAARPYTDKSIVEKRWKKIATL
jgi:hypothetical protein